MTDLDLISRTALAMTRAVHRQAPKATRGRARQSIRTQDRHLFDQALACAVAIGMVRLDGPRRLLPGRSPDPWHEDSPPHCRTCSCGDGV